VLALLRDLALNFVCAATVPIESGAGLMAMAHDISRNARLVASAWGERE